MKYFLFSGVLIWGTIEPQHMGDYMPAKEEFFTPSKLVGAETKKEAEEKYKDYMKKSFEENFINRKLLREKIEIKKLQIINDTIV